MVSPFRCASPASVTSVPPRLSCEKFVNPFEMRQPGVGDPCVIDRETLEAGHPRETFEASIGNSSAAEIERPEGQPAEVFQPAVGDPSISKEEC